MIEIAGFEGWLPYAVTAGAGVAFLAAAAWGRGRGSALLRADRDRASCPTPCSWSRRKLPSTPMLLAVPGVVLILQGTVSPVVGLVDGASRVVCCFDDDAPGVQASADGAWASRDGWLVDLRSGEIVDRDPSGPGARGTRAVRKDSGSAYFGGDAAPTRAARFTASQPLPVQFGDGTTIKLDNPNGNCAVVADEGRVAAVVVSDPERSWLDWLLPLRGAGTIDFVDLRTGRTLRSVTIARLDGFSCVPGQGSGATLVGLRGGARWVLSQERWLKVIDVPVPPPARQPTRALALAPA